MHTADCYILYYQSAWLAMATTGIIILQTFKLHYTAINIHTITSIRSNVNMVTKKYIAMHTNCFHYLKLYTPNKTF